jgi:hypothetical protein
MNNIRRTAIRITPRHTRLRYGDTGILARFYMVTYEGDGTWTLSGTRGPLGGSGSYTFEDRGYRTKRDAYAAADALIARDLAER